MEAKTTIDADQRVLDRSYQTEVERRERAERVAAAHIDVLGIVAHDLRNPLGLIDMTAQFLLEGDPPVERRRELLVTTRRAVARMARLVGDLLDAVQMQSGGLHLELHDVDVVALLRAAAEDYRALAAKNYVDLRIEPIHIPLYARGDEMRILQAVGNLLDNALKFTRPGGTVSLSVSASEREVTFQVTDTGPGIPENDTALVFDRFWQARKNTGKGVGLGLAIVKGIVDAHGGRLWVRSSVGVGSTFAFTLPRCFRSRHTQPREEMTSSEPRLAISTIAAA